MEIEKGVHKKSISIIKKLERYLSWPDKEEKQSTTEKETKQSTKPPRKMLTKSNSFQLNGRSKGGSSSEKTSPNGCFSVYVGSEKKRFVIKAKAANHPLFKMLLEDAELEYGFDNGGPLLIPCDVDTFYKVLADMDDGDHLDPHASGSSHGRGSSFIARTQSSYDQELLAEIRKQNRIMP